MSTHLASRLPQIAFICSLLFFSMLYGMFAWKNNWLPAPVVRETLAEWRTLASEPSDRPHRVPMRHDRPAGVHRPNPGQSSPGLTLISSYWQDQDWYPGARLIDEHGNALHHWNVIATKIFTGKRQRRVSDDIYLHGTYLFPNGDLLFNLEYLGLARVDSCGKLLWKSDFSSHHSIYRADDGNFWVSGYRWIKNGDPRRKEFPGLKPRFGEDLIYEVDEDGKLLTQISLLKAIYNSPYRHLLWSANRALRGGDQTHLNDVEILSAELAEFFPLFEAGDILVSSNFLSLIAVLNPEGTLKWVSQNQFYRQHDPNFESSGLITVFDNRPDGSLNGDYLGGSRLVAIDPNTMALTNLYPTTGTSDFFTSAGGKHQLLANGNRLVSELHGGRAFEINPQGEIIWEWLQQLFDADHIAEVNEARRYTLTPEQVAKWPCSYPE